MTHLCPHHCPGGSAGISAGAVAVVVAAVFLFAVRHQAEVIAMDVIRIILVTAAVLAGIAVALAVAVAGVRRHRRIAELAAAERTSISRQSVRALPARQPAAITAPRLTLSTAANRQRIDDLTGRGAEAVRIQVFPIR